MQSEGAKTYFSPKVLKN